MDQRRETSYNPSGKWHIAHDTSRSMLSFNEEPVADKKLLRGAVVKLVMLTRFRPKFTPSQQYFLYGIACSFLLLGAWWSWEHTQLTLADLRPLLLALVVALALLGAFFSVMEYRLTYRHLVGQVPLWGSCMKVTALGSLANLLPIPGGVIIRLTALKKAGASVSKSSKALASVGLIWLGISLFVTGICLLPHQGVIGLLTISTGTAVYIFAILLTGISAPLNRQILAKLTLLECLVVLNAGLRTYIVLVALGIETTILQGMALVASGSIAVAAGIVPAGLGIRELIAASIGSQVGIGGGAAFLASALNNVISILILVPLLALAQFLRENSDE